MKTNRCAPAPEFLVQKTYLRLPAVLNLLSIKKSTFYDGIKRGLFPAPTKIGLRVSVWPAREIEALLDRLAQPAPPPPVLTPTDRAWINRNLNKMVDRP